MPASPSSLELLRDAVQRALTGFIDEQAAGLTALGAEAARLVEAARTATTGGKRLRAAFCWWGHHAVAPPYDEAAADALVRACAALELLHASALVHDDYMDASDVRRGRPAAHRAFADLHHSARWAGSPEQYGAAAAILLGDLLLSWSDQLLRTCGLPEERVLAALAAFDRTRTEVIAGQFLDVSAQAVATSDVDVAMRVLRYKSAKYSVERPLHIGATLAGAGAEQVEQLSAFGLPLGEAFQLRDDLLGVFGDPAATGKPAGDDLSEGKRTVLVALALDGLPPADAALLDRSLGTDLDRAQVERLCELIESSGARRQVEEAIEALTGRALSALEQADVDPAAAQELAALAQAATQRTV